MEEEHGKQSMGQDGSPSVSRSVPEKKDAGSAASGSPFLTGEVHTPPVTSAPAGFDAPKKETVSQENLVFTNPPTLAIPDPQAAPKVVSPSPEVVFSKSGSKKWLVVGIIVVIVALFGLGAYLYFRNAPLEKVMESVVPDGQSSAETPSDLVETPVVEPPFALDKPNYLSLDTESISLDEGKTVFGEVAVKMQAAGIVQPVEFLITDSNNNPVAFSRFAYLMHFELSPELLAFLDEGFSVFAFIDGGKLRLGLALTMKDATAAGAQIVKEESSLPSAFRPLVLLNGSMVGINRTSVFRSGSYNSEAVRFTNIDANQNLSLDYTLRGNRWFVGTSKDTLRAMLDQTR